MSSNPIILPPYINVTRKKAEIITLDVTELAGRISKKNLNAFKPGKSDLRAKQLAASDWIVKNRINNTSYIERDAQGKPYLSSADHHISISHTQNILSLIHHNQVEVSIDIEFYDRNVLKIMNRFTDNEELSVLEIANLSNPLIVIWSIKECLFKILGRQGVHFLTDLRILSCTISDLTIKTICTVKHHDIELRYMVNSMIFDPILVSYIDESPF
ncbi:MAG: 4'-phosphopantetheinyl transferase superfamily protein [Salibacteraceae bacterium]|nr:4'-phosphopantetheinyl transferase superfamily protein [Salibacteraceae bacterium]MDP4685706.1 4'-phosphopantetheinyl transferase superfamily protein [Salibacteraceae bacterium]MDP4762297.1 4'-phosphopantetheinyl transferase superfamily protein [Salibacteraceae bacterium]MDP4843382.1 4'-phosphopantetheinyl transferase superfamily protein [Salibacteraceae bacterium]MDP4935329.1 4'-phosphopantetheinyl transferase superfamily protein [Salibacteraceae bacterium]